MVTLYIDGTHIILSQRMRYQNIACARACEYLGWSEIGAGYQLVTTFKHCTHKSIMSSTVRLCLYTLTHKYMKNSTNAYTHARTNIPPAGSL